MRCAIVGSGAIGSALASQFARAGIDVLIANSRGPSSLSELIDRLGSRIHAARAEEALDADVVFLAIPFTAIPAAVRSVPNWNRRIVIDASNAIDFPAFTPTDLGGRASTEVVADALPGARVVKAFNTLPAALLASDPAQAGGKRVIFFSGNDPEANAEVARLIERLDFAGIDLGKITEGGLLQQFGGRLPLHNLLKLA